MLIKSLGNDTYDVFYGNEGWYPWARFKKDNRRLVLVRGFKIPDEIYHAVYKAIVRR